MKIGALLIGSLFHTFSFAQQALPFGKEVKEISISSKDSATFQLALQKGGVYRFIIEQKGIAVSSVLTGAGKKQVTKEPDDIDGYEKFEYTAGTNALHVWAIKRFEHPQNKDSGTINIRVESLTKAEIERKARIKQMMAPENEKNVTTIDIDHFWEAYSRLKDCKSFKDSVAAFQDLYLDRGTNGLVDFMRVRNFTAEGFVKAVTANAAYYQAAKKNTELAKKAIPLIEEVFTSFKQLYPNFQPFKVCFAIGMKNTGGTVSNNFVLIGTEVTVGIDPVSEQQLLDKIKAVVAHECVHTQQKQGADPNGISCPLLYQSLREGSCDLIAGLVTGRPKGNAYGFDNEKKLWEEFKSELCTKNMGKWLYNGNVMKDRPGDLGYFIGYAIAKEYYDRAADKKQAVADIIELTDAVRFLELSHYDQKVKR